MSNTPQRRDTPGAMAIYWFNRKRSTTMSPADVRSLEAWLAQDAKNEAAFRRVEQTWSLIGDLEEDPAVVDAREENEAGLRREQNRRRFAIVAASLAVVAVGGWIVTGATLPQVSWLNPPPQAFRTTVGQRATITLPDQSVVTLDTNTILRARMTPWSRRIELEQGRAFFQVAKDRSRPFIVAAAGKTVRATGTAFDVRSEESRFEVTLVEGRVRVEEQGAQREDVPVADMRPGWRLAVATDARWRIEPVDVEKATAWHNGTLSFFNEPVDSAVAEMNRYSHRQIVFRGVASKKTMIGNFRAGDVDTFVTALEINKVARIVVREDDRIEITAR